MEKFRHGILVLIVFVGILFVLGGFTEAVARVDVNVNIGLPPPFVISAPPPVVVIPGTYVYAVPDIEVDILFYQGYCTARTKGVGTGPSLTMDPGSTALPPVCPMR